MERESFEDEEAAAVLNNGYIAIKVDREERPDLDHLYMTFCQALTGQGGWPLTIIMTPEKKPFFAGTYFPRESSGGLPGLMQLLAKITNFWRRQREKLVRTGEELTDSVLQEHLQFRTGELSEEVLERAYQQFSSYFDPLYGGFGQAPKFPTPHNLTFLLRYYTAKGEPQALKMVEKTLVQMYKGGIFDHLGFGFARYSTDQKWLVPHFEKMLYDNALLAIAYLEAYQITKKKLYQDVAEKIFSYVLNEMTSPEGAFYSAEDADSEGVEGKLYLWTPAEVIEVLGKEAGTEFCRLYDLTEKGNFAGSNIPNLIKIEEEVFSISIDEQQQRNSGGKEWVRKVEEARQKLLEARKKRVPPFKDDKVLTAWNGLMIAALAKGGRVLEEHSGVYLSAAEKAVAFIRQKLVRGDGRLLARYRDGEAAYPAYLDDYAFLVWALLELYESTGESLYLDEAFSWNKQMLALFADAAASEVENDGTLILYLTGEDGEKLLIRPREIYDGALPAGNSVAAWNLIRLAKITGDGELRKKAERLFDATGGEIRANPLNYTFMLQAYLYLLLYLFCLSNHL